MFNEAYSKHLKPINDMRMWPPTTYTNPLPPKPVKTPQRPKLKRRRDMIQVNFSPSGQVRREGTSITCKNCFQVGHNKRTCKGNRTEPRLDATPSTTGRGRGRGTGRRGRPRKRLADGSGQTGGLEESDDPISVDAMFEQNKGTPLITWPADEDLPPLPTQPTYVDQEKQADMEASESHPTAAADAMEAGMSHITQDRFIV